MGFYLSELFQDYELSGTWPNDAIEISERWYEYLIEGQGVGKVITVNEYGQPVLADPAPPAPEEIIQYAAELKNKLMDEANTALLPLQDAVDLGIATESESAMLIEWKKYRVLLNRVDTSKAPDIEWPEKPT
ncbi:tail fiber assembly protein [Enterobacter hormaechei]|uniref:tail fiber assembly protein n=1 Tax=Enterobacter cloacae complex TaxID=354276 RepID=UPI00062C30A1|nr:tail fiber assembly protein [Enterobacter hormaechei]MZJ53365.1 tail fiber assembly protein [Enterobacter hormaechei]MZJ73752.1 tail fiber assembly protein [Enterobacter hormaechei]MZK03154.1 tail fiber assembly protein [Enterobacter hormaechei]MZK13991.1 tail fiber assembly protein [Enterobacter hormaechei]MZK21976.1 tail fiber assembly protein [Enterobacter hormaechei]